MLHLLTSRFSFVVDQDGFLIRERLSRLPLKMDVPEKILGQAHVQPGSVADFLHENGISFLYASVTFFVKIENIFLK